MSPALRPLAAVLIAALAAACHQPLALEHEFFAHTRVAAADVGIAARRTVAYHGALQTVAAACPPLVVAVPVAMAAAADGPDLAAAPARASLAAHCAVRTPPAAAWQGGVATAYRRWVEDQAVELPDPTETAAGAGGG